MEKASTFVGLDVHKESIDVTMQRRYGYSGTIAGDLEAVAKLLGAGDARTASSGPSTRPARADSRSTIPARTGDRLCRRQPLADPTPSRRSRQDRSPRFRNARPAPSRRRARCPLCPRARGRVDPRSCAYPRGHSARSPQGPPTGAGPPSSARTPLRRQVRLDPRPSSVAERSQARPPGAAVRPRGVPRVDEATARLERIEGALVEQVALWRFSAVVDALQAMRGIDTIAAITLVTELGDLTRFDSPRELMAFLGLVPSEHSSGGRRRLGAITKCGNSHARRTLVEAAWAYRHPARIGRRLLLRSEKLPVPIRAIAWKAQGGWPLATAPAASRTRSSSPPSRASSADSSGPSLALTQPTAEDPTTSSPEENCSHSTNTELSDGIVGARHGPENLANPFPGSATSPRPSLERGSSETIHGLAVTNPRISAGSTVVSTGAASGGPLRELGQRGTNNDERGEGRVDLTGRSHINGSGVERRGTGCCRAQRARGAPPRPLERLVMPTGHNCPVTR